MAETKGSVGSNLAAYREKMEKGNRGALERAVGE